MITANQKGKLAMNNLQKNSQTSLAQGGGTNTSIRELSTGQQKDWIERIFTRLAGIYGSEFSYKWADVDNDQLKAEWAETLGGFRAEDIASALKSCRNLPKPPNLPEFAALCRQNMNTRLAHTPEQKLTPDERAAAAKVAYAVAASLRAKAQASDKTASIIVNGIPITPYRQWALNLMRREAGGERLNIVASDSWREVLGYSNDVTAKQAIEQIDRVTT